MDTTAGLEPQRAALEAGQEGRFVLSVRNDSEIVEEYAFRVVGDLAEWSTVEPAHASVFPGQSATAVVALTAPRTSAVTAGEHPLGVHVRPVKRPENAAVPEGVVEVLPFYETVADLSPQSTKGRRGGTYRVAVDNRGNAPVAVALVAKSASDGMEIALSETEQIVEPGNSWSSEIRAQPVKRLWRGAPVTYPFTVMVTPEQGLPTTLAGTQNQTPVLPSGILRTLLGLLALVLVLGLGAWSLLARTFPPWAEKAGNPTASPTVTDETTVSPTGETTGSPTDVATADPTDETTVSATDVATADPTDETTGSPNEPQSVTLPAEMVGLPADPLIEEITAQGVNVMLFEEAREDFVPGAVVRTEPAGGTTVRPGDTVQMWVAIAPPPVVETFPVRIPLSALPVESAERLWPQEPSAYAYTIDSLVLENPQADEGTFAVELAGQILYEGTLDSVSSGDDLIREAGEGDESTRAPEDLAAPDVQDELPLEPITVPAGQQLRFTTTCREVGAGLTPPLTACNETFELQGRALDAAAYG